jgi:NOL1/NOP2/fmu family ribosome biogenesis protein
LSSKYVVCVGKEYMPGKRKFTEIGVGFETKDRKGIRLQLDVTLILSPDQELFVFLRNSHKEEETEND